ncbi:MAG TPA: hypothetical protein VK851_05640 [Anaerolineales bacterium]|nr:hypothetical protein [Anaerolineales bacterium]
MNYYQDELTAQYNREKVREDFSLIHIEQHAAKARVYHPGVFTRIMHSFSIWMISTGKNLHNRYEIPSMHCNQTPSSSLAR